MRFTQHARHHRPAGATTHLRRATVAAATAVLVVAGSAAAYADQLRGDADTSALTSPHGNSLSSDQAVATTAVYPFSVTVADTGNSNDNVFAATGDTVTLSVSVVGVPAGWSVDAVAEATPFTAYSQERAGTVTVAVPANACGQTATLGVSLTGTASNGRSLGGALKLTYAITGRGTCPTEPPAPVNEAPTVGVNQATVTVDEGSQAANTGAWADPDHDAVALTASYGDVVQATDGTWSWSATPADGPADSTTVTITATDEHGAAATTTFALVVRNVAPTVTLGTPSATAVDCRNAVSVSPSFSDPGVADAPWTVTITWGDGSDPTTFDVTTQGAVAAQSHTYLLPGTYPITATVTDKDGGVGTSESTDIEVRQTYTTTFLQPVDASTAAKAVDNTVKNGRTVPVKITLVDDCRQVAVTDPATVVTIVVGKSTAGAGTTSDAIETSYSDAGAANANSNLFRWSTDGFWIYNLDTKGLALTTGTTYRVDAYVAGVKATVTTWARLLPTR